LIADIEEPFIQAHIHLPVSLVATSSSSAPARRGVQTKMEYLSQERVMLSYEIPFSEIMFDFFDKLKSLSPGLRLLRLRIHRLARLRPDPAEHLGERGAGRRPVGHRPSG
jgi:GTP-binding protein LepA